MPDPFEDASDPSTASPCVARWRTFALALLAALVAYLPAALGAVLLQFDDNFFFGPDNAQFRDGGLTAVLTEPIANAWLPVAHASLYFDYSLAGDAPFLPHLHSILLHALAAFLLARLLLRLSAPPMVAHAALLLFVLHPALAEAVAWASSRKVVLSAVFVLLSLRSVVRLAEAGRSSPAHVLLAALFGALAMLSNATAVVLPFLAALVVLWRRGGATSGLRTGATRWVAPAVLLCVIAPIALVHRQVAAEQGTMLDADLGNRLAQVPGAFWHYVTTALWPTRLNVLYPEVDTLAQFRTAWLPGTVALAVTVLGGGALLLAARTRAIGVGLWWFALALLPFNTAFPASSIAAADRYLYLAIPGLALAVAALPALVHRSAAWLAVLLALPLAWLCGARAHEFRDDETLWRSSLAVEPTNAVAHLNLVFDRMRGSAIAADELREHLEAAVAAARYPIHELRARALLRQLAMTDADYERAASQARATVAAAERQLARERAPLRVQQAEELLLRALLDAFEPLRLAGDDDGSESMLRAARQRAPEHPQVIAFGAIRELAALQPELLAKAAAGEAPRLAHDDPRAIAAERRLAAAIDEHPQDANLWLAQALWHRARDQVTAALRCYREATRLKPDEVTAWLGAARMLREKQMYEPAAQYAQDGFQRRPDPRLLQEQALALVGQNRLDDAEQVLSAYMQLRPDDRDAAKILANLLIGRAYTLITDHDKRAEVERLVADALRLHADEHKARLLLGRLAFQDRRFRAAVQHLEIAFDKLPDVPEARQQLTLSLESLGWDEMLRNEPDDAVSAWLRCLEVAPADFDTDGVRAQLRTHWTRLEQRGVERLQAGDRAGAIEDFRTCLRIDPEQHWASWLLATAQHGQPDVDLAEQERLCRQAVGWQRQHDLDASRQVYLLAHTLTARGEADAAREVANEYLERPSAEAEPAVLAALERFAGR